MLNFTKGRRVVPIKYSGSHSVVVKIVGCKVVISTVVLSMTVLELVVTLKISIAGVLVPLGVWIP